MFHESLSDDRNVNQLIKWAKSTKNWIYSLMNLFPKTRCKDELLCDYILYLQLGSSGQHIFSLRSLSPKKDKKVGKHKRAEGSW